MGSEQRAFPRIPGCGDLLADGEQLWRVAAVVFGERVDVYTIQAADTVGPELDAWAAPVPVPAEAEPTAPQQADLFTGGNQ